MENNYRILANCVRYEEWNVDENGKPEFLRYEFDGVELDGKKCYKVVDSFGEVIEEDITFKRAQKLVADLSDHNAIS